MAPAHRASCAGQRRTSRSGPRTVARIAAFPAPWTTTIGSPRGLEDPRIQADPGDVRLDVRRRRTAATHGGRVEQRRAREDGQDVPVAADPDEHDVEDREAVVGLAAAPAPRERQPSTPPAARPRGADVAGGDAPVVHRDRSWTFASDGAARAAPRAPRRTAGRSRAGRRAGRSDRRPTRRGRRPRARGRASGRRRERAVDADRRRAAGRRPVGAARAPSTASRRRQRDRLRGGPRRRRPDRAKIRSAGSPRHRRRPLTVRRGAPSSRAPRR